MRKKYPARPASLLLDVVAKRIEALQDEDSPVGLVIAAVVALGAILLYATGAGALWFAHSKMEALSPERDAPYAVSGPPTVAGMCVLVRRGKGVWDPTWD